MHPDNCRISETELPHRSSHDRVKTPPSLLVLGGALPQQDLSPDRRRGDEGLLSSWPAKLGRESSEGVSRTARRSAPGALDPGGELGRGRRNHGSGLPRPPEWSDAAAAGRATSGARMTNFRCWIGPPRDDGIACTCGRRGRPHVWSNFACAGASARWEKNCSRAGWCLSQSYEAFF